MERQLLPGKMIFPQVLESGQQWGNKPTVSITDISQDRTMR
jgi:hypothetical protein